MQLGLRCNVRLCHATTANQYILHDLLSRRKKRDSKLISLCGNFTAIFWHCSCELLALQFKDRWNWLLLWTGTCIHYLLISREKKEFHQTSTKNIVLWLMPVDEMENYQKWQLYLRFKNGNAIDIFFVSYGSSGLVNIMTESYPSLPYTWLKLRMQIFIQFFAWTFEQIIVHLYLHPTLGADMKSMGSKATHDHCNSHVVLCQWHSQCKMQAITKWALLQHAYMAC